MSSAGLPPVPASESPRSGISHEYFPRKNLYHYIKMDFIFQYPLYLSSGQEKGRIFEVCRKSFKKTCRICAKNYTMITCQSQ